SVTCTMLHAPHRAPGPGRACTTRDVNALRLWPGVRGNGAADRFCAGRAAARGNLRMRPAAPPPSLPRAQLIAERAFATVERFLHIEAVSGVALLLAAVAALVWANSSYAHAYEALWHLPLAISLGEY